MEKEKTKEVDEVLISMKERYFRLYAKEDIGKTREITHTLDRLEIEILKRQQE